MSLMLNLTLKIDIGRADHSRRNAGIVQEISTSSREPTPYFLHSKKITDTDRLQVTQSDSVEEQENSEDTLARIGSRSI